VTWALLSVCAIHLDGWMETRASCEARAGATGRRPRVQELGVASRGTAHGNRVNRSVFDSRPFGPANLGVMAFVTASRFLRRCGVQQHSSLDPPPPLRAGLAIAAVPLRAVRPGRPRTRCENLPLVGPKVPHTGSDRNAQNRLTPAFADVFFTQPSLRYSTVLAAAPKTPRPLVRRSAHTAPRFTTERSPGTEVRIDYDRCSEARLL
jgi:hypothetical protein